MNTIEILKYCILQIEMLLNNTNSDEKKLAYQDSIDVLNTQITQIEKVETERLMKADEKFDIFHNNYDELLKRGHIGIPTDYHKYLSMFTTMEMTATDVFNSIPESHKEDILIDLTKDKNMIEQMVAYRHDFNFITHSKGHDGINQDGNVFEVKNHQYKKNKDTTFAPSLKFDRLSQNNLRKLKEGRPDIILNVTDKHKLLLEMKLNFTDELVKTYENKLKSIQYKDTSGCSISFTDYCHAIKEVSFISKDIEQYNLSLSLIKYLNTKFNMNIKHQRKSTMCPKVKHILDTQCQFIVDSHKGGQTMTKIASGLTTKTVKITPAHIKRVLTSNQG